jgi:hypothetical protein
MEHADQPAGQDPEGFRHSDGQDEPLAGHRDMPGPKPETVLPPTVFVSSLGDGALFLKGWPVGQHIYLNPDEALPVWRALKAAFAPEPDLPRDNPGWSI